MSDPLAAILSVCEGWDVPDETVVQFRASVVWTNERAVKAIQVIADVLRDVSEDFGYRDDVKRAIRAANYLSKHVTVHAEQK